MRLEMYSIFKACISFSSPFWCMEGTWPILDSLIVPSSIFATPRNSLIEALPSYFWLVGKSLDSARRSIHFYQWHRNTSNHIFTYLDAHIRVRASRLSTNCFLRWKDGKPEYRDLIHRAMLSTSSVQNANWPGKLRHRVKCLTPNWYHVLRKSK